MANNFNSLIIDAYQALDVVSREQIGMIPAVTRNHALERVAVGQLVQYDVAPIMASENIVAAMAFPTPTDENIQSRTMTISKSKRSKPFMYTGEETRALANGPGMMTIQAGIIAQGMRALCNEIEADLVAAACLNASRAYGTVGVVPFADKDTTSAAQTRKILIDNGAPGDRQLVLNTTASAVLGTAIGWLPARQEVAMLDDQGVITAPHQINIRETGQSYSHTSGTAAGATTDATGYVIGTKTFTLASAGTGTILAGDVITFAGDVNKYVVKTGDSDVSNGGTITLVEPGLMKALPTAATAITVTASFQGSAAFARSAINLVTRLPALPNGGDMAVNRTTILDERSGLAFDLAEYAGYRARTLEVAIAWGQQNVAERHTALLIQ